jgi:LysR family transcriptional regulator AphB
MAARTSKSGTKHPPIGAIAEAPGNLEDVALFVAVAEHASFIEAARRTRTPTSTVSRAVARLEEDLGVRLLQRTSRKVAPTEDGRQLLLRAGPLVDEMQQALGAIADRRAEPRGLVRITAPSFTGATRVATSLATFALAHQKITIELDASNVVHDLITEGFDLALRVGPLASAELVSRKLWDGAFGLFATPSLVAQALGKKAHASKEMLERVPAVLTRRSGTWRFRSKDGRVEEVTPHARFTVNHPRAAVEVARRGVGFVLAPLEAASDAPELVQVRTSLGEPEPAQIYAVYPSRRMLSARVRLVLDWLAR